MDTIGISSFLANVIWKKEDNGTYSIDLDAYRNQEQEFYINAYCLFSVIDFISTIMSQIELQTYIDGIKIEGLEWHRLNYKPNQNSNAKQFWHEFWSKLLYYQEVLVVPSNGNLIIADSFNHHPEYCVREDIFENVCRGDMTFYQKFRRSEVFYLNYSTIDIKAAVNSIMDLYSKMASHTYKVYTKKGGEKGILNVNSAAAGPEEFEAKYGRWINSRFKSYFDAENAVMPLFKGMTYTSKSDPLSKDSFESITGLINSALERTCNAYKIPAVLLRGEVAGISDALNLMLTTCVDPLAKMLATEITSIEFTQEEIVKGCKVKAFTNNIKHTDIFDVSASFDKLFADGFSHNQLCDLLDMPTIQEPWADKHFVTKNYADAQEGGENNV